MARGASPPRVPPQARASSCCATPGHPRPHPHRSTSDGCRQRPRSSSRARLLKVTSGGATSPARDSAG
eukprot:10508998-Alexandrium_andersonii.AAC.1